MRRHEVALAGLAILSTSACGVLGGSVEASWVLHPDTQIVETDTAVEIWVLDPYCEQRLSTDKVDVGVEETDTWIIVTTRVPDVSGDACNLSANPVLVDVVFSSPIGGRALLVGLAVGDVAPTYELRGGMPISQDS